MIFFGDYLWRHIRGSATKSINSVGGDGLKAEAKVYKFELLVSVE